MSNLNFLWELAEKEALKSDCLDKQVGCIIFGTTNKKILGIGHNTHINSICDCTTTKSATHAEINAIASATKRSLTRTTKRSAIVTHKMCKPCSTALFKIVDNVYFVDQKNSSNEIQHLIKCTMCKKVKDKTLFFTRNTTPLPTCKKCSREREQKYNRTIKGCVSDIYSHQLQSAKCRNMAAPTYTLQELQEKLLPDFVYQLIYTNWVNLGYQKSMKPSVDRLSSNYSYTMNNIQIVTWGENNANANQEVFDGKFLKSGISGLKQVRQLTLEGVEIAVFASLKIAERTTKINSGTIGNCCRGTQVKGKNGLLYTCKTAGGFKWEFIQTM